MFFDVYEYLASTTAKKKKLTGCSLLIMGQEADHCGTLEGLNILIPAQSFTDVCGIRVYKFLTRQQVFCFVSSGTE